MKAILPILQMSNTTNIPIKRDYDIHKRIYNFISAYPKTLGSKPRDEGYKLSRAESPGFSLSSLMSPLKTRNPCLLYTFSHVLIVAFIPDLKGRGFQLDDYKAEKTKRGAYQERLRVFGSECKPIEKIPRAFSPRRFIVRVIKLVNSLPKTSSNPVIIGQILRSVTSMGANDQEADGTLTKRDFLHCFTTVRKEGKETNFWLSLIADTNPDPIRAQTLEILPEGSEIVAIISSIINNTRKLKSNS